MDKDFSAPMSPAVERTRNGLSSGLLLAVMIGANACAAEVSSDQTEMVAGTQEDLFQAPGAVPWANGKVYVCFSSPGAKVQEEVWLQAALADAWQAASAVTFTYSSGCPYPSQANYVTVTWRNMVDWGVGGLTTSYGSSGNPVVNLDYCNAADCVAGGANWVDYQEAFKMAAVHEMGHALGMAHEQQRSDYTTLDCNLDTGTGLDNGTLAGGNFLTTNPDRDSIMNYCRGWDGTNPIQFQTNYKAADRISSGDTAGIQNLYGKKYPYWVDPAVRLASL